MESRLQPQPGENPAPPLPTLDDTLYVIHYSQERAENCVATTPTVSAIIVQHVLTNRQQTFAALHLAEREGITPSELSARLSNFERGMLHDFFAFSAGHTDATWLHWGMRSPSFGFEVLSQRARRHGLDPDDILPERMFDLASYLKRLYGCDYAPHPRLWHAIHRNGVASQGLLSEAQAAEAWMGGNHAAVLRSLSRKVNAIARLYERLRDGTFECGGIGPPSPESSGSAEPSGGRSPVGDQGPESGPPAPTAAELADSLRRAGRKGKAVLAALVLHMADRRSSTVQEVAEKVHGNGRADCKRIAANVRRTNKELEALGADFRLKVSAGYIHNVLAGTTDNISPIDRQ